MKRLLKRITGFILLITIMTSAIGPTVFAAQKNDVKTNFKYEVGNIEDNSGQGNRYSNFSHCKLYSAKFYKQNICRGRCCL